MIALMLHPLAQEYDDDQMMLMLIILSNPMLQNDGGGDLLATFDKHNNFTNSDRHVSPQITSCDSQPPPI